MERLILALNFVWSTRPKISFVFHFFGKSLHFPTYMTNVSVLRRVVLVVRYLISIHYHLFFRTLNERRSLILTKIV